MEENYNDIPKEEFEFVNAGERITDVKFIDKPVSYMRDAFNRFCKSRASIVAAIIIIGIFIFAFLTPLLTFSHDASFMDSYYAKKGPYNTFLSNTLGIATGNVSLDATYKMYDQYYALGIGAENYDGNYAPSIREYAASDSEYNPVVSFNSTRAQFNPATNSNDIYYNLTLNDYLTVGFIYLDVEQDEYDRIVEWQDETGLQVLYPIIADNEYNPYQGNAYTQEAANYWYKATNKYVPYYRDENGNLKRLEEFSSDLVLEDNYLRDEDGNVRYWMYSAGGSMDTAMKKIRVLYYNYYQYKNGFEPSYIFGTDSQGYDLALRMAEGVRLSLVIAVSVSLINFCIGGIYGAVEGFYGGTLDIVLERIADVLNGVPFIVVATLFQIHLAQKLGAIPCLLFAFVLTGWIPIARMVRTQFYRFKNQEYVMAAKTLGASDRRVIFHHIYPNAIGTLITETALVIPRVIFQESMLSFLGIVKLGGTETTSLGTLLSDASGIWTNYPHLMLFPAAVISLLMISFNLFGNGLRDAFNPSLRGVEE